MSEGSVRISESPGWLVKPKSRRLGEFYISDSLLLRLFQRPDILWSVEANPLPEDARIVGIQYAVMPGGWRIFVESETFDEVLENEVPPMLPSMTLHIQTIDDERQHPAAPAADSRADAAEGA